MKKTIKSLFALAVAAFAFTACSDVPEPEGYNPKQGDGLVTYVAEGTGVSGDPYNVAGVLEATKDLAKGATTSNDIYTKGYVAEVGDFNSSYGNITFYITDSPTGNSKKFYVYRCLGLGGEKFAAQTDLKVGDEVIVCGKITNYNGTIEYTQGGKLVKLNGQTSGGDNPGPGPSPTGENLLTNGDFETWADGLPTNWKSASTASASTLTQSTDAHGGSYSVNVAGDASANKRLAYKELNLKAGTYKFAFYAKSTTGEASQTRPGYVVVANGAVSGSYQYGDYASLNNTSWTEVSTTFTLSAQTTVCLVVMNPKTSNYATAQDILIDDATLVTSDGGIADGETGGGDTGGGDTGGGDTGGGDAGTGTAAAPLTVAQVYTAVAAMAADAESTADYYVRGKVCSVKYTFSAQFGTATFNISDDGGTSGNQFTCYGTYYLGNKSWVDGNTQIAVGDEVVVCGKVVNYKGNQPEFVNKKNYLVTLNGAQ